MPKYEVLLTTRVLNKEGYKSVLRQLCGVIWDEGGVVKNIGSLGTRPFPHYQEMRTESGVEKVWKGTIFSLDTIMKESTLPLLEEFADLHNNSVSCKIAPSPIPYPLWCSYREKMNEKEATLSQKLRNFDKYMDNESEG